MRKFVVDDDRCIKCGGCEKACPFGAIKLEGGVVLYNASKCHEQCRACILCCKKSAIQDFDCEGCGSASGCEGCQKGCHK